jgi:hypothetical protein
MMMTTWRQAARLFAASFLSLLVFIALNLWVARAFPARCSDCHAHIGLPFAYYDEGGFAGDDALLWFGIIADLIIVLGVAFRAVMGWERHRSKRR